MTSPSLSPRPPLSGESRQVRPARRWFGWLSLCGLVLSAALIVLIPAWLIQPFRAQTPGAIQVAYVLRAWSPAVTLFLSLMTLALGTWLWRGKRSWWRRALLVLGLVPALGAMWLARQNHFEWMFNPLSDPAYVRAPEAGFVAGGDMVLAVEINGEAAAYPVRQMAYHHVVHDLVGGVPIVATY